MSYQDLFSKQAASYCEYRPRYPLALYEFLQSVTQKGKCVWDCATGSGQAALDLAKYFPLVVATDASFSQLSHASRQKNIYYLNANAEQTPLKSQSMDLVTVAQALHWFDFELFYPEVQRILKPKGIFAAWGYDLIKFQNPELTRIVKHFYEEVLKDYWAKERAHIDNHYQDIPFPFKKMAAPDFELTVQWNLEQILNYLHTWSAVQTYHKKRGVDPIESILFPQLEESDLTNDARYKARFPFIFLLGMNA